MKKNVIKIAAVVCLVVAVAVAAVACGSKSKYLFGKETISLSAQIDILSSLSNGSADIGVMDSVMAGYYMNNGSYKDSMKALPFNLSEEEYGIGAKKGNDALISKINEGLIALQKNGELKKIGDKFGLYGENLVGNDTTNPVGNATDSSWNKVVASGKLNIGYTVFAPIAYKDADGNFTGFDIELAKKIAEYLNATYNVNLKCEFIEIDWSTKEALLENGSIDLVWNGMTITKERKEGMSMSIPYLANKQAIIILKKDENSYDLTSLEAFKSSAKNKIIAVEEGSAAEELMIVKK